MLVSQCHLADETEFMFVKEVCDLWSAILTSLKNRIQL